MATTSCPNCGKPLRPGAHFCGHCGATIPAEPTKALSGKDNPEFQSGAFGGSLCPHCGNSIRPGAKFCPSCGKSIDQVLTPPQPLHEEAPPAVTKAASQEVLPPPASPAREAVSSPGRPAAPPPAKLAAPAKKSRSGFMVIAGILFVLLCILAFGVGGLFFYKSGRLSNLIPSLSTPTILAASIVPGSPTTLVTIPTSIASVIPASPIAPTQIITSTSLPPASTSIPLTATATIDSIVMIEDDFSGNLYTNWNTWGKNKPTIKQGPTDHSLALTPSTPPAISGGVLSKQVIPFYEGVEILMTVMLNQRFGPIPLIFDWHSGQPDITTDEPEGSEKLPSSQLQILGPVHIEILPASLIVANTISGTGCQLPIVHGFNQHTYLLHLSNNARLLVSEKQADGNFNKICELDPLGGNLIPGPISFSGAGWVTEVKVTIPK